MDNTQRLDRFVALLEREPAVGNFITHIYGVRGAAKAGVLTNDDQLAETLDGLVECWRQAGDPTVAYT